MELSEEVIADALVWVIPILGTTVLSTKPQKHTLIWGLGAALTWIVTTAVAAVLPSNIRIVAMAAVLAQELGRVGFVVASRRLVDGDGTTAAAAGIGYAAAHALLKRSSDDCVLANAGVIVVMQLLDIVLFRLALSAVGPRRFLCIITARFVAASSTLVAPRWSSSCLVVLPLPCLSLMAVSCWSWLLFY